MVVSSFSPVAWPAPTKNPASSRVTRRIVLREYVGSAQGRCGSSVRNRFVNSGSVHIAGFFAGEKASKRIAWGATLSVSVIG